MPLVTMADDELAAELTRVRAERDDWERIAIEAVRILLDHPELWDQLRVVVADLDRLLALLEPSPR